VSSSLVSIYREPKEKYPMYKKIKDFLLHHKILSISALLIVILFFSIILITKRRNNVEYIIPRYGEIIESIYGLGKVKTDTVYEIKLGIPSTVQKLYVTEGSIVKKKDLLVMLDDSIAFRAPFSGTITQINATEKQTVFPQQPILRLEDYKDKYIEVSLEQQGALRVKPGQPAKIMFESLRGELLTGSVTAIFSRSDEFLAHINVPGLQDNILPGMTADISIEVDRKSRALLVPVSALASGQVKVLRSGKKINISLKIGSIDGNWAEVIEGDLTTNDVVIIKAQ
jgi:multidrug efflux pump subunit AcrA (membrane-fusion protein)